jgi:hypothetical protein
MRGSYQAPRAARQGWKAKIKSVGDFGFKGGLLKVDDKRLQEIKGRVKLARESGGHYNALAIVNHSAYSDVCWLLDEVERLRTENVELRRERDAAVADIKLMLTHGNARYCCYCKDYNTCTSINDCKERARWRGPQDAKEGGTGQC